MCHGHNKGPWLLLHSIQYHGVYASLTYEYSWYVGGVPIRGTLPDLGLEDREVAREVLHVIYTSSTQGLATLISARRHKMTPF